MRRVHKRKLKRVYLLFLVACFILLLYFGIKFGNTTIKSFNKEEKIQTNVPVVRLLSINKQATESGKVQEIVDNIASESANTNDQFGVDKQGKVFVLDQVGDIPSVIYAGEGGLSVGKELSVAQTKNLLDILNGLKLINYLFERVFWTLENNLIVQSKPVIIFDLKSDSSIQLASLQLILEKAKIEKGQIDLIDLRFEKPVLRYAKESERK